jgi:predicted outer membrane repeat protein
MKHLLKYISNVGIALLLLSTLFSCVREMEMVNPPKVQDENGDAVIGYFVKENGTGKGTSWDDAMSPAKFRSMFAMGFKNGDEIFMAGGTYYVGEVNTEFLALTKGVTIKGGYDPNSTGYDTNITYPTNFETIISGDINQDGKADEGDCHLMEISSTIPVSFYGITFKGGYLSTSTNGEHAGINVHDGTTVNMSYCKIQDCLSNVTLTNDRAGGAALELYYGTANLYKTIISNNKSNNRGGAIRVQNGTSPSQLYMDACLVYKNGISGDFGGAIQVTGNVNGVYINNTTMADNYANFGGAGINTSGPVVIMNSTLVRNNCAHGSHGHCIRIESNRKFNLINSIVLGTEPVLYNEGYTIGGKNTNYINDLGYNVLGSYYSNNFVPVSTDVVKKSYSDVFGTNDLADNDGYPQSIALPNRNFAIVPVAVMNNFVLTYNVPFDPTIDQRNVTRNTSTYCPGAFEYK